MAKDDKYIKVVSKRPFGSSYVGETSNNKAGANVVDKEVVKGLKKVKADTSKEKIKNRVLSIVPFGTTVSVAGGLARDYQEGDLTKQNWLTKTLIHSNPSLNTDEFANDELNQFKGDLVTDIRNSNAQNEKFSEAFVDSKDLMNKDPSLNNFNLDYVDYSSPKLNGSHAKVGGKGDFMDYLYSKGVNNVTAKVDDLTKIDEAKAKEFENISNSMGSKGQERLAWWKATAPEERRFIDDQKRFTVNEDLSLDSPLNKRALGEGNVVPDLNDIDRKYLPKDFQNGADIHKDIGDENLTKAQDPKNVDENGKPKDDAKFNTASDKYNNIHSEQFGDGTKNTLGLGAGASATGIGIFLNQYWLAIVGVIILAGVVIYFLVTDKNKKKSKKKTYTKRKSKAKSKKSSKNGSNPASPINIFLGGVNKEAQSLEVPKSTPKLKELKEVARNG